MKITIHEQKWIGWIYLVTIQCNNNWKYMRLILDTLKSYKTNLCQSQSEETVSYHILTSTYIRKTNQMIPTFFDSCRLKLGHQCIKDSKRSCKVIEISLSLPFSSFKSNKEIRGLVSYTKTKQ